MQQDQRLVAAFTHHCWMLRTTNPPDDYVFGDCLTDDASPPGLSVSEFFDCMTSSGEYHDGEEDAFVVSSEYDFFYDPAP